LPLAHRLKELACTNNTSTRLASCTQIEQALEVSYDSFTFDAFKLAQLTQGHPLSTMAYFILQKSKLLSSLNLDAIKTARFLRKIEAGYRKENPYHNATHACNVLQVRAYSVVQAEG